MANATEVAELKKKLEKKIEFPIAVKSLTAAVSACPPNATEHLQIHIFPAVQRTHVLLKTRHTNPQAWKAGLALFTACLSMRGFLPVQLKSVQQYVKDAKDMLQTEDEGPSDSNQDQNHGEMDILAVSELLTGPRGSHYDDAGPIVDDAERWRRAQISGREEASSSGGADNSVSNGNGRSNNSRQRAELQRQILEGIQAVYSGMEAIARGTEAIERELDSVLSIVNSRAGQNHKPTPPPASKSFLANLPRITLCEPKLEELGKDAACAVCTEELHVGDEVQLLPCKHYYHVECLAPWVNKHNSCPTCRFELPTDDPHYEAAKEKAAEDEAERRGAENAVSHNEFMYI